MVESGRITRSAPECEMSRSCHSATFSTAALALPRRTRASPLMRSEVIGLRLWGIALDAEAREHALLEVRGRGRVRADRAADRADGDLRERALEALRVAIGLE